MRLVLGLALLALVGCKTTPRSKACELAREDAPAPEQWRSAFNYRTMGAYLYVFDTPPSDKEKIRASVNALGLREQELVDCESRFVVYLPATDLGQAKDMDAAVVDKSGGRLHQKAIVPKQP